MLSSLILVLGNLPLPCLSNPVYYYCVYFMPDSVPLIGPCRLLHILGQKKTLRRGEENPIRVFHASRLLHACEQVSYKPLLNPVSKSAARSIASKGNFRNFRQQLRLSTTTPVIIYFYPH